MDLPSLIASFFDKIQTGILDPLTSGIYGLLPGLLLLALIASLGVLVFSSRPGAKVGAVVTIVVIAAVIPNIPEVLNAVMSWFGGTEVTSHAADAAQKGIEQGSAASLGSLGGN